MSVSPLGVVIAVSAGLAGLCTICNAVYVAKWIRARRRGPGLPSPILVIPGVCALIASGAYWGMGGSAWWMAVPLAVEAVWLVPSAVIPRSDPTSSQ
jgi:hypothetical protein